MLGPLEVAANGRLLPLGGAKQRAVLAVLLLHANEPVSADRLIDALWGETPPDSAANMVQGYVSRLRKVLEADMLVSGPPGYTLRVGSANVDSSRFARLAAEGRALLDAGDPCPAAERLREALALWRGPALADLEYEPFARPEVERLEELRLTALEDRIEAELALGRHERLVPELRELVAEHPLRERLRGQLMLALYRCRRQAEALEAYRDTRLALRELGLEPGPELRGLEAAILRQDPELAPPAQAGLAPLRAPRRRILVVVAAVLVAGALAAVLAFDRPTSAQPVAVRPHSVAVVDPGTNSLVADILTGGYPGPLAADARWVYVANIGDATLTRIDPRTRKVFDTFAFSRATDLVALDGHVWAANGGAPGHAPLGVHNGTVLDYAPGPTWRTLSVGPNLEGGEAQTTLAADVHGFSIWAGNQDSRTIRQIDRSLDRKLLTIHGVAPAGLAAVGDSSAGDIVWASDTGGGVVARIDEHVRRVTARIRIPGGPARLAADASNVWVLTGWGPRDAWIPTRVAHPALWRIDAATNTPVRRIPLGVTPIRVALGGGSVWVAGQVVTSPRGTSEGAEVVRIDESTGRVLARIPLRTRAADGILYAHGLVWVAIPASQ